MTSQAVPGCIIARVRRWIALACWAWRLALLGARAWLRRLTGATSDPRRESHGPTAYRIYAFNNNDAADSGGFYRELQLHLFEPSTWEEDVRHLTGWSDFRVEVRYTFRHKKYRMVLHPGDRCEFPPYAEPAAPACRLPKGMLSARLQGPAGCDVDCDVTTRVMKYQGPRGDFHAGLGLRVRVHEMFPFDDHSDNALRFSHLRIMDTMARLHDLPYASNPEVTLVRQASEY